MPADTNIAKANNDEAVGMRDQAESGAFQPRRVNTPKGVYPLLVSAVHTLRRCGISRASDRVFSWRLSAAEFQEFLKQVSLKDKLEQNAGDDEAIRR